MAWKLGLATYTRFRYAGCLFCLFTGALSATTRLAAIGDFGTAGPDEAQVAALVNSWAPLDGVLALGDCNYPAGEASTIDANVGQYYRQFMKPYLGKYRPYTARRTNAFWPCPGNHDWMASGLKPYLDYMPVNRSRYYDVVVGNVHIFSLDSDPSEIPLDGTSPTSKQGLWLRSRLLASQSPWRLVMFHHPPYSSGTHGSSTRMQWPFAEWGASAVLSGHDHLYERVLPFAGNASGTAPSPGASGRRILDASSSPSATIPIANIAGFPYFVNGAGGANSYPVVKAIPGSVKRFNAAHGAMLIQANSTVITFRFFAVGSSKVAVDCYRISALRATGDVRTRPLKFVEC